MTKNRVDRWLAVLAVSLLAVLGAQLFASWATARAASRTVWLADWAETPQSLEEAVESADEVVVGRVTRVRPGEDIVARIQGEPGSVDRIPTEIVTLQVENRLKQGRDGAPRTVEVFRTGATKGTPPSRLGDRPPEDPPPGVERPPRPSPPSDRNVMLTDDPPYQRGERYVLMLKPGPAMRVDSREVRLRRPVSPEGRYRVGRGGRIEPVSERVDFVREFRGQSLEAFERQIGRAVGRVRTRSR